MYKDFDEIIVCFCDLLSAQNRDVCMTSFEACLDL